MVGYAEVLQTISAMVIFSIILLTANRMIHRNTYIQIEGDLERQIVVLAQDIMEEGRTKEFDENTTGSVPPTNIPGDFTAPASLGPESGETTRTDFNDFDDFHGWEASLATRHGNFDLRTQVFYVTYNTTTEEFDSTGTRTTYKKMRVFVSSPLLTVGTTDNARKYTLETVRNYHAD